MRLQTFREKLKSKTKKLQNMVDKPERTEEFDSEVQAQIFDMAGDMRKIMDRIPKYKDQKIKIQKKIYTEKQQYIKPYELLGKIIHYEKLYFGVSLLPHEQRHRDFSVISDHDEKANIQSRVIQTQEFINMAQKISEDDNIAAKYISEYALQILKNALNLCENRQNKNDKSNKNYEYHTASIIIDLMDILRKIDKKITGNIKTIVNIYEKSKSIDKRENLKTINTQMEYGYIIERYRKDFGVFYQKINRDNIGYAVIINYNINMPENITNAIPKKYIDEKYHIDLIMKKDHVIQFFNDIKDYYK